MNKMKQAVRTDGSGQTVLITGASGGRRLFDTVTSLGIRVDQLVNNAGGGKMGRVTDADLDTMIRLINLDVIAVTSLFRLFGGEMVKRGSGRIMNVSSLGAMMADPYFNVYGPSKAFDYYLSAAMYGDLLDSNVTVTTLCSGPIKTNWAANAGKADSSLAVEPRVVAEEGFAAMQSGRLTVIATVPYKIAGVLARLTPDAVMARIIGKWQSKLIRKSN